MCVELSQPSTTAQRAHMRHHPFFITPFFSQGQSQHSRSVAALVAVFTRFARCAKTGRNTSTTSCENSNHGCD